MLLKLFPIEHKLEKLKPRDILKETTHSICIAHKCVYMHMCICINAYDVHDTVYVSHNSAKKTF